MPEVTDSITGAVVPGAMETVLVPVPKPMTKTEAKTHLADAKRSLGAAQAVMKPTPQWIVDQTGIPDLTEEQVKRVVAQKVLAAEESLAALRRWLA